MRTQAWPLEADEIRAVEQAMRFGFCKWDIYHRGRPNLLPDVIVLTAAEHQQLVATAESCWQALRHLESAVIADDQALAGIGIEAELIPLLRADTPASPRLSRCDFHLTVGGRWMISEFNEDGPGGFAESAGLNRVLKAGFEDRFSGLEFPGDIGTALVEAFKPWPRIGLIYATAYSEDLQQIALIADWLREAGHEAVTGSPANLQLREDQVCLFDQPIDALFRHFPGEWISALPEFELWPEFVARLPMMNTLSALAAQSKRFYAAAAEHQLEVDREILDLLDQHLPTSHYLTPARRERLLGERDAWVLKGAFGRMGDTVRLGIGCSPEEWAAAVDKALAADQPYAIQERFDPVPLWFSDGLGYATIGLYLVDGAFAGYFSRVSPFPVINYDSSHVATLVETA